MSSQSMFAAHVSTTTSGTSRYVRDRYYRRRMWVLTLLADLAGFAQAILYLSLIDTYLLRFHFLFIDPQDLIMLGVCLTLFMTSRLYPAVGLSPATEIKLVTKFLSMGGLVAFVAIVVLQSYWFDHFVAFLLLLVISLITVLFSRWIVRFTAGKLGLWGEPVVVVGDAKELDNLIAHFAKRLRLGFIPVMAVRFAPGDASLSTSLHETSLNNLLNVQAKYFAQHEIFTVLIQASIASQVLSADHDRMLTRLFRRVIIIFDLDLLDGAALRIQDFEGMFGLEAQKSGLSPLETTLKRAIDLCGALLIGLVTLPLCLLAALLIRLSSPGPIFYTQQRVGRHGRMIKVYKFRTMVQAAERVLAEYLALNPQAKDEWEQTQKLKHDPRIIRWGGILRKFSIDELPQLINVFKGEMSLVGPRPIVEAEAHHYKQNIEVYQSVRPGITGMWQVSGRNQTSYEERVNLDAYYVRNWSIWLDVYILLRTVWVVLSRDGAY